jgi:hypothetical protein
LNFSPSFLGASTFGYNFTTFILGASNINTIGNEVPTITSLWIHNKKKLKCDYQVLGVGSTQKTVTIWQFSVPIQISCFMVEIWKINFKVK